MDAVEGRDDATYERLVSDLERLYGELTMHWTPASEATFGLPIGIERGRRRDAEMRRRAEAQAQREEAVRQHRERQRLEALDRVGHLRDYATRMLGAAAAEVFLSTPWAAGITGAAGMKPVFPTDLASAGDVGLEQMKAALWRIMDARRRAEEAETRRLQAMNQRADMLRKAMLPQLRYDETLVERFMTGRHPKLPGRQSPLQACATDDEFREMIEILQVKIPLQCSPGKPGV